MKDETDKPNDENINADVNYNLNVDDSMDDDQIRNCRTDEYEGNENDMFINDLEEEMKRGSYFKRRSKINSEYIKKEKGLSAITNQIKEEFSLDKLGKIKWAKEHASANKPMNKIKEFTKNTKFCRCCNLPISTPGIIEPFSFNEDIENFAVCGKAVSLYFNFYRYCIMCLIIALIMITLPMTLYNNDNLPAIEGYCNYLVTNNISIDFEINIDYICDKYIGNTKQSSMDWIWKVSADNILDFIKIFEHNIKLENKKNSIVVEKILFNGFSLINFICMISLFIINIYIIIIFKAKIRAEKVGNIQLSDYTLFITGLQNLTNEFIENREDNTKTSEDNESDTKFKSDLVDTIIDYENLYDSSIAKYHISDYIQYLINNLFIDEKDGKSQNVYNITLCYKLNEFMEIQKKYEVCKHKIFQVQNNPHQIEKNKENHYSDEKRRYYTSPFTLMHLNCLYCSNRGVSLEELNKEQEKYEKKLNSLVNETKLNNFCGCLFVTFSTIKEKEKFYNSYPHFVIEHVYYYFKNIFYRLNCFKKKNRKTISFDSINSINVYLAPEPEDVIWENLEFTILQRIYRMIFIYFLTVVIIYFVFKIVYYLNKIKIEVKGGNKGQILKYLTSLSISIILLIINKILKVIMGAITKLEKQKSLTNFYLSYSIKITIFTFVVSAIIPLLSHYINTQHEIHDHKQLLMNIMFIFLTNSFVTPLFWTLNVRLFIRKIRIYLIERKKDPDSNHFKTQKELNDIYQYPDMKISAKYAYIFMTILMTMFYLPIFPLGIAISLLGLILAYYLEKFNFTHIYKRPEMLNEQLGEFHFNFFILTLLSYSIGNYIFLKDIYRRDSWAIMNIVFFGLLSFIPYNKPISYFVNLMKDLDINLKPVDDIYFSFYNDYQRQNPFTKREGMHFYVNELKKKGYISNLIYDILIKNIKKINVMEIYYNTSISPKLREAQYTLSRVKSRFPFRHFPIRKNYHQNRPMIEEAYEEEKDSETLNINSPDDDLQIDYEGRKKERNSEKKVRKDINNNNNDSINIRKNTYAPKSVNMNKIIKKDNDMLDDAFTEKDNFLLKQYNNPLLLSIGLGILNLAFVDNSKNKYKSFSKKNNTAKFSINEIEEEEEHQIEDKE